MVKFRWGLQLLVLSRQHNFLTSSRDFGLLSLCLQVFGEVIALLRSVMTPYLVHGQVAGLATSGLFVDVDKEQLRNGQHLFGCLVVGVDFFLLQLLDEVIQEAGVEALFLHHFYHLRNDKADLIIAGLPAHVEGLQAAQVGVDPNLDPAGLVEADAGLGDGDDPEDVLQFLQSPKHRVQYPEGLGLVEGGEGGEPVGNSLNQQVGGAGAVVGDGAEGRHQVGPVAIEPGVGALEVVYQVGLGDGVSVRVLPDLAMGQLGFELPAGLLCVVVFHLENKYRQQTKIYPNRFTLSYKLAPRLQSTASTLCLGVFTQNNRELVEVSSCSYYRIIRYFSISAPARVMPTMHNKQNDGSSVKLSRCRSPKSSQKPSVFSSNKNSNICQDVGQGKGQSESKACRDDLLTKTEQLNVLSILNKYLSKQQLMRVMAEQPGKLHSSPDGMITQATHRHEKCLGKTPKRGQLPAMQGEEQSMTWAHQTQVLQLQRLEEPIHSPYLASYIGPELHKINTLISKIQTQGNKLGSTQRNALGKIVDPLNSLILLMGFVVEKVGYREQNGLDRFEGAEQVRTDLVQELQVMEAKLAECQARESQMEKEKRDLRSQANRLRQTVASYHSQNDHLRSEYQSACSQIHILNQVIAQLNTQLQKTQQKYLSKCQQAQQQQTLHSTLQVHLDNLYVQLQHQEQQLRGLGALEEQVGQLEAERRKWRRRWEQESTEVDRLMSVGK